MRQWTVFMWPIFAGARKQNKLGTHVGIVNLFKYFDLFLKF